MSKEEYVKCAGDVGFDVIVVDMIYVSLSNKKVVGYLWSL